MDRSPAIAVGSKHAGGWMTVIALGLLAVALLVCLFVLIGFPAEAQMNGSTAPHSSSVASRIDAAPSDSRPLRRQP
jgi:hypothetical protein